MDFLSELYANLRAIVAAAWPETLPNGIWEVEHVKAVPWTDLSAPYAVIAINGLPSASWGAVSDVYQPAIEIYYVAQVTGPAGPVRERLMKLRKALVDADQTKVQLVKINSLSWGDELVPNVFFTSKNDPHRAGRLVAEVLVGECING